MPSPAPSRRASAYHSLGVKFVNQSLAPGQHKRHQRGTVEREAGGGKQKTLALTAERKAVRDSAMDASSRLGRANSSRNVGTTGMHGKSFSGPAARHSRMKPSGAPGEPRTQMVVSTASFRRREVY
jgi:hypothetical protein